MGEQRRDSTGEIDQLVAVLQSHLSSPQKSERWAMYRLIAPVVDFANSTLGFTPYFEFNQTSAHGASQSVDIALLDGTEASVLVEAKRLDRAVAAEQIAKYLEDSQRGIVSNGAIWVLCDKTSCLILHLFKPDSGIDRAALQQIIAFIRGTPRTEALPDAPARYSRTTAAPVYPLKARKAVRKSNAVEAHSSVSALRAALSNLDGLSPGDRQFCESFLAAIAKRGGIPEHLRCELRASRLSLFDSRRAGQPSQRVGRIEFGRKHPDILVLTEVVDRFPRLASIAPPAPHDKGPHMRRFRLANERQCKAFGLALAEAVT